jgi:GNAT superfamily N-acetyltransferase
VVENSAFCHPRWCQSHRLPVGFISQVGLVGYVHLVAVRASACRQRLGQELFNHFIEFTREQGCTQIKAITTPSNPAPLSLTKASGMQLFWATNTDGIPVIPDDAGPGQPRVVFWKAI